LYFSKAVHAKKGCASLLFFFFMMEVGPQIIRAYNFCILANLCMQKKKSGNIYVFFSKVWLAKNSNKNIISWKRGLYTLTNHIALKRRVFQVKKGNFKVCVFEWTLLYLWDAWKQQKMLPPEEQLNEHYNFDLHENRRIDCLLRNSWMNIIIVTCMKTA